MWRNRRFTDHGAAERKAGGATIEPRRSYRPLVRFIGPDGREYEVTSAVSSSPAPYRIGEPAAVRCDPSDPADARIDRPLDLWFAPAMLAGFGLFAVAMGLIGLALR